MTLRIPYGVNIFFVGIRPVCEYPEHNWLSYAFFIILLCWIRKGSFRRLCRTSLLKRTIENSVKSQFCMWQWTSIQWVHSCWETRVTKKKKYFEIRVCRISLAHVFSISHKGSADRVRLLYKYAVCLYVYDGSIVSFTLKFIFTFIILFLLYFTKLYSFYDWSCYNFVSEHVQHSKIVRLSLESNCFV